MSNHFWNKMLTEHHTVLEVADRLEGHCITPLPSQVMIKVSGPEAERYLQGQVSCDVTKAVTLPQLGCCCNNKGRVQAIFHLFTLPNTTKTDYYLSLERCVLDSTIARLKQYAIFSKVTIEHDDPWVGLGGCMDDVSSISAQMTDLGGVIIPLGSESYEIYLPPTALKKVWPIWCETYKVVASPLFKKRRMQLGLPTIYPETVEKFLPHDLNLQCIDGINFNKGCYTGQEIISRMHYRATLKSHMRLLRLSESVELPPATPILCASGQRVGESVESCQDLLLAFLRDEALDAPLILSGYEGVTLTLDELPYSISTE